MKLVSIVIDNYNFAQFLREAIESALRQTYPAVEVIVVDDGSTDASRSIIAAYGDRIRPVLKENGGQGSAFNAGFAAARGEIIHFLDSDDLLFPDTVERVAALWAEQPDLATVQYRLEVIDERGAPTGVRVPADHVTMPSGDLHDRFFLFNNNTWWTPTSGNAFSARALHAVLPMPEAVTRYGADYYVSRACALVGPVRSMPWVGALYRSHGANSQNLYTVNLDKIRGEIVRLKRVSGVMRDLVQRLYPGVYTFSASDMPDVMQLSLRIVSLKLDRRRHPVPGDTMLKLAGRGIRAALARPDVAPAVRWTHAAWFAAMLVAPKSRARDMADRLFYPRRREPWMRTVTSLWRRAARQA